MWKIPEGIDVRTASKVWEHLDTISSPLDVREANGTPYSKRIFTNGTAITLGIKPIIQETFDSENYDAKKRITETETEIVYDWESIVPKMSLNARKKQFSRFIKLLGKSLLDTSRAWVNYYNEMDALDLNLTLWIAYISNLKSAYQTVNSEVLLISEYDALIAYIKCEPDPLVDGWKKHLPEVPE